MSLRSSREGALTDLQFYLIGSPSDLFYKFSPSFWMCWFARPEPTLSRACCAGPDLYSPIGKFWKKLWKNSERNKLRMWPRFCKALFLVVLGQSHVTLTSIMVDLSWPFHFYLDCVKFILEELYKVLWRYLRQPLILVVLHSEEKGRFESRSSNGTCVNHFVLSSSLCKSYHPNHGFW